MKKHLAFSALCIAFIYFATVTHVHAAEWRIDQAQVVRQFVLNASEDALPILGTGQLDAALREGEGPALDAAANDLALRLARMHLLGYFPPQQKAGWQIADSDEQVDLQAWLDRALVADALPQFFASVRPGHPDYAALRAAYAGETDPARKRALARNMERWRWMPRQLGDEYILVNAASFEARLWRQGTLAGVWPVIVGKPSTPTPVFSAIVTGVTLNPWWNIPASIVREMGGRFSASKGYTRSGGQWRQKPGPGNALGQMKLVMPNPYKVYMHDTPGKNLFARDTRAFSHGCIRTGDAIGFAATLLEGSKSRAQVDAVVRSRATVTFDLPNPLPVYVAYFTASPDRAGVMRIHPDIYNRDGRLADRAP